MKNNELVSKFKLPGYVAGKTFAEASKLIDKKFEGRNDIISKTTKEALLERLAEAQEHVKQVQMQEQASSEQNQMFLGGMTGGLMQGMGTAGNAMGSGENTEFINKNYTDPNAVQDAQRGKQVGAIKDTIGSINPIIGMFRGIEKMGNALGNKVGGEAGASINAMFSPDEAIMANSSDRDSSTLEKIGGFVSPIFAGVNSFKQKRARQREASRTTDIMKQDVFNNDFAYGGPMDMNPIKKPIEDAYWKYNPNAGIESFIDYTKKPETFATHQYTAEEDKATQTNNNDNKKINWNKIGSTAGEALRYAPVAMNAYQLSQLKKPRYEALNKLDTRFKPEYVDERSLQNIAGNEMDNTVNALTQMGGSEGAMRNAILAAGLNKSKSMSDAYMRAAAENAATNMKGQEFNLNVDQANLGQSNLELDINDRNAANYDTQKSRLLGQMGTDLGNIGKEQMMKQYPVLMGLGYSWRGKYIVNDQTGEILTPEQAAAKEAQVSQQTTQKSKGGFLTKDVVKHINNMYMLRNNK